MFIQVALVTTALTATTIVRRHGYLVLLLSVVLLVACCLVLSLFTPLFVSVVAGRAQNILYQHAGTQGIFMFLRESACSEEFSFQTTLREL
jgi:hypothetical protein